MSTRKIPPIQREVLRYVQQVAHALIVNGNEECIITTPACRIRGVYNNTGQKVTITIQNRSTPHTWADYTRIELKGERG